MLPQGIIPQEQWTDEELAQAQAAQQAAAQQPQEPTIDEQLAQSQLMMGRAELQKVQVQTANLQQEGQIAAMKLNQAQQTLDMKGDEQAFRQQLDINRQLSERLQSQQETINTMAETMDKLKGVLGVDGVIGPNTTEALANQALSVTQAQEAVNPQIAQDQPVFLPEQSV